MPKITLVAKDLDEVVHRKLVKQKDGAGFGNRSWADYFRHITKDEFLKDNVSDIIQKSTRDKMLGVWCNNFAENVADIREGLSISDLVPEEAKIDENVILGPAIVVGRGPSIYKHKHINLLAKNGFKGTIVVSDGSLIDCLKQGVVPDYVVSVDGNNELIWKWYDHPLVDKFGSKIKAILCVSVAHNVVERCNKAGIKIYWFNPQFDDYRKHDSFTKIQMLMTSTKTNPNGAPNVACLTGDSLIYTVNGPKPIKDILVGDSVYSYENPISLPKIRKVTKVINQGIKPVYELKTETHSVKATEEHKFLTVRDNETKWVELQDLKIGQLIIVLKKIHSKYLGVEKINSITPIKEQQVYDITIEDTHNFIVDGIISHNCGGNAGATAWVIATNLLRRSPVGLIGIDLGYLEETPMDETAYYKQLMEGTKNNVSAVATIFKTVENPYFKVKVKTDTIFQKYKESWIEMLKQTRPNIRTINCTEGGSLFSIEKNVPLEYMKFKEFLKEFSE